MKKILLALGTIATIATPLVTVLACGSTPSTDSDNTNNPDNTKNSGALIDQDIVGPLKVGQLAFFSFEGRAGGTDFESSTKFNGGTAPDYKIVIGSNQFIAGFESGMIGMMPGETRIVPVTFPENYQAAALAGQKAWFKVVLFGHTV